MNLSYTSHPTRTRFLSFADALTYAPSPIVWDVAPVEQDEPQLLLPAPPIAGLLPAPKAHPLVGKVIKKQGATYGFTIVDTITGNGVKFATLRHEQHGVLYRTLEAVS